jgi:hypothetical protein
MSANELRVGNLVTLPYEKDKLYIVRGFDIDCLQEGMDSYAMMPICITEEWLERFGFHETQRTAKYVEFSINNEYFLRLPICKHLEKDYWVALRGDVKIKYIHQLQNLYYALTGKEL